LRPKERDESNRIIKYEEEKKSYSLGENSRKTKGKDGKTEK
jgi:hypothetical protein